MLEEDEIEVKLKRVVKDPKLSIKRFSQYVVATDNGKRRILQGCKYPGDYVPKFYEMARKLICDFFSANYEDHELYFDEFKKQGAIYRAEAKSIPENKDGHKNRICSANGLDALNAMAPLLSPILTNYTLNSNLKGKKDAILKNGVRLGAMADMLLFRDAGVTQVGFLKFNFTAKKLSKEEAEVMLFVLQTFFESKGVTLNPDSCFLIDVFAWRIYTPGKKSSIEKIVDKSTIEIRDSWDSI